MGRIAKWRAFSKEEFAKMVQDSRSFAELAGKVGYTKQSGSSLQTLKKVVQEYNLSTEHFKGQAWNKDNYDYSSFKENSYKKNGKYIIKPLFKLRGRKCECCGLEEWLGKSINLEVHHIDGDRTNNSLENLQLLCPNCHSYTPNFRKKNKKEIIPEEQFVFELQNSTSIHSALKKLGLTPSADNYGRARELIHKFKIEKLY